MPFADAFSSMALRMQVPAFINCRDRVSTLVELVDWLERAGCEEIYLIDNDSAYEPLLDYYHGTSHHVIRLGWNYGKYALWEAPGVLERAEGRHYIYTDPDVVPVPECPLDAIDRFAHLLARYPAVNKAGFGLRIDDIPDHYRHKDAVLTWEGQYWQWPLERNAYYAAIDTTFALYRPGGTRAREAIRTGPPYVARHDSWYLDFENLSDEDAFYGARAASDTEESPGTAHWGADQLPDDIVGMVERVKARRVSPLTRNVTRLRWTLRGRRSLRRPRRL